MFRAVVAHLALAAACAVSTHAFAVRLSTDGRGQALVYPYYTARSNVSGNAFATALSVTNMTGEPKAVKVRLIEGRTGAEVHSFNLYLDALDVWVGGIIAKTPDAGGLSVGAIYTPDRSCTAPLVSRNSNNPTLFSIGNDPDRGLEGHVEIVEMGAIDPGSAFAASITHKEDRSAPNASSPPCTNLPVGETPPAAMKPPTGGLMGSASFVNVNDGTDFSVDAIALAQWSDKVQWGAPGSARPTLADASPVVSVVVDAQADDDVMVATRWNNGRDAVSALFMVDQVVNDFSVELAIKAATDWIVTLPTRRFYVSGTTAAAPFRNEPTPFGSRGEQVDMLYYDRESQSPGALLCFAGPPCGTYLSFAANTVPWMANEGPVSTGIVLAGRNSNPDTIGLKVPWINGWGALRVRPDPVHALTAPSGESTTTSLTNGSIKSNVSVTYHGLPIVGFAAQSYSTTGLPGISPNVLSNYGGSFAHRYLRRIVMSPDR